MSQNIGDKIDITGFLVQRGTISAAQLVRRDFLCGRNFTGVFFTRFSTA